VDKLVKGEAKLYSWLLLINRVLINMQYCSVCVKYISYLRGEHYFEWNTVYCFVTKQWFKTM